jgi:hypothetical protein
MSTVPASSTPYAAPRKAEACRDKDADGLDLYKTNRDCNLGIAMSKILGGMSCKAGGMEKGREIGGVGTCGVRGDAIPW